MKFALFLLVAFACVLSIAEVSADQVCEPGSVFKKDCNECKCNEDGTDMACTRKMCSGDQDGADPVPENAENTENQEQTRAERQAVHDDTCKPGETYKQDCNDCTCPPSGRKSDGACTLIACYEPYKN